MSIDPSKMHVALLAGGTSGEREISLASGAGARAALEEAGFAVTQLDPADQNDLVALVQGNFDVAFLCLHGKRGEDGAMQGMLELLDIPYTGPGIWSSATAMDKSKAKVHYLTAGIPTPASVTMCKQDDVDVATIVNTIGNNVVVKPATEGSALGVFMCQGAEEIASAITQAFAIDHEVIVEAHITGTELTVAVVGNDEPFALPVIQIVPQLGEFYDFESKYAPGGSKHLCPAPLQPDQTVRAQELALGAHRVLGCRGMSRTDMFLDENGDFWVLETNTIPGMTETSLLPDAARAAGMSFPELCTKLIEFALEGR